MEHRTTAPRKALFILWICLAALAAGCAGTQSLPAPRSPDETLVAVPVVIIDGRFTAFTGRITYQVKLENIDTKKTESIFISTDSHGYNFIKGLPEGKYLVKEYTTNGMANNDARKISLSGYLTVTKGTVSVFPGKLVVYIYDAEDDSTKTYLYPYFREIDEKQMNRIVDFLKTDENYRLWNK